MSTILQGFFCTGTESGAPFPFPTAPLMFPFAALFFFFFFLLPLPAFLRLPPSLRSPARTWGPGPQTGLRLVAEPHSSQGLAVKNAGETLWTRVQGRKNKKQKRFEDQYE